MNRLDMVSRVAVYHCGECIETGSEKLNPAE